MDLANGLVYYVAFIFSTTVHEHRLRPASEGSVTVPAHHRGLWEGLQVERRPLTIYEEVGQWN